MDKLPIFLVFWWLLVCHGFPDASFPRKRELQCKVASKDLKTWKESIDVALNSAGSTNTLDSLLQKYKGHMESSNECNEYFVSIFVAFLDNVKEILFLKANVNVVQSVWEKRIQDMEKERDEFVRQVENEKKITIDNLKTVNSTLQKQVHDFKSENLVLKTERAKDKLTITALNIENREFESAKETFLALDYREDLIQSFVSKVYNDDLSKLAKVLYFVVNLNDYSLTSKALTTLFQNMESSSHTEESEIFLVYYEVKRILASANFKDQVLSIQHRILALFHKTQPVVNKLMKVLENDIYKQNYYTLPKVLAVLGKREQELFVVDLAKQLFSNICYSSNFLFIMKAGDSMATENMCVYFEEIKRQLDNESKTNSMLGFQLWSIILQKLLLAGSGGEKCKALHQRMDSTKRHYQEQYENNIYMHNFDTLHAWHTEFPVMMKSFFSSIVIPNFSKHRITDINEFLKLNKYIKNMPSIEDTKCLALEAIETRLKKEGISLKAQAFLNLKVANDLLHDKKCSGVKERSPSVFQYLLGTPLQDCRIESEKYSGEPLYCPSGWFDENNYVPIFTWYDKEDNDGACFWNILQLEDDYFVFRNLLYSDRELFHDSNSQFYGTSTYEGRRGKKYRIEAGDGTSHHIKIVSYDNRYVYASSDKRDSSRRFVKLSNGPRDGDVWRMKCGHKKAPYISTGRSSYVMPYG